MKVMTKGDKRALWKRLREYRFDHLVPPSLTHQVAEMFGGRDASTKAFASKLARKLDWSTAYALRVIDEYKKFVYLGMVGNFSVTPSQAIDKVWHEHVLFTRAYHLFCREILNRDFHHSPELVPNDVQTTEFETQYLDTLELYRREFNSDPPQDIWAQTKFRFNHRKIAERRLRDDETRSSLINDNYPLYTLFDGPGTNSHSEFGGFQGGGGGRDGGAGASRSWDAAVQNGSAHQSSHHHHGQFPVLVDGHHGGHDTGGYDAGGHDSGSSGGDSSPSCSSATSCSAASSCGGGGCGGGGGD